MKYLYLYIAVLFACINLPAETFAQSLKSYQISGVVADSSSGKPMDYVTVSLKKEDGVIVKTILSKEDGSFLFTDIRSSKYQISLISVGYQKVTIPIDLDENKDLGKINISSSGNRLKEVVITADKPIIKQEIDRMIYDLQADPESKVYSVLEMMRKVPLLSVDGDDNVLFKGSKSYKIMINGKPSGMIERNPKDVLRSMPASSIQSIEVITSPSSKYDSEGIAGIINIVTTKKIDNGYNASVNVNERYPLGGPGTGGSFTFKQGKTGISAFGGASTYNTPETTSQSLRNTMGIYANNLDQNMARKSNSRNAYFGSELSFELDSLNLISAQFNLNGNRSNDKSSQISLLTGENSVLQAYDLKNDGDGYGTGADAGINYQLGFKSNKARLLTFSYRYMNYGNTQHNVIDITRSLNYSNPGYSQSNEGSFSENTFQLDYVHPLNKLSIETGLKGILRVNKSDFQYSYLNPSIRLYIPDPSRSNKYKNQQDVFAAYNSYTYNLKNWGFRAGLRLEQTLVNADFISTSSEANQNYFSLIPAINVYRKFKDSSTLALSYKQRLQRPGINQLNPFIDRSNPSYESGGNPDLKTSLAHIVELSFNRSKKVNLSASVGYMYFDNIIGPVLEFDPLTNITRSTIENAGSATVLRSNLYISYPLTKKINLTLNADLRYGKITTIINGIAVPNEQVITYMNISGGYRFEKGWRINGNFTLNSTNIGGVQSKINGYMASSISTSKDLIKDKLSFSASINNPFNKFRINKENSFGPYFIQKNRNEIYYRTFNTSLNYRFGKLKESLKKNNRGISNDDVNK